MGKYFGTDGFRGEAGIDLTADHAYKVGRFLGWYYNALRERNGNLPILGKKLLQRHIVSSSAAEIVFPIIHENVNSDK